MPPPRTNIVARIANIAAKMRLTSHFSNLKARGKRMNEISNAKLMGIRIDLATTHIANRAKVVAMAKNIF